jgi:HAMP domain-containing protein
VQEQDKTTERKSRTFSNTLIEPFKQIKMGVYVITVSVLFVLLTSALIYRAFVEQYQHVMSIFNVVDPNLKWELIMNPVFMTNAKILAALFVGYVILLFTLVFWLTHKYYGPLVSVERFIDNISKGEYNARASIRQRDELQRLVGKLNAMAERLESRHGSFVDEDGNRIDRRQRSGAVDQKSKSNPGDPLGA